MNYFKMEFPQMLINYSVRLQSIGAMLPYIWKTEFIYRGLIKTIDASGFEEIKQKFRALDPKDHLTGRKYLNSSIYIRGSISTALMLGLSAPPKYKILDLGCGPAYFLVVCRYLGHEVQGLDLPGNPLYNDLVAFFQIPRIDFRICPFQPLPPMGEPFDLITAVAICFHKWWDREDGCWKQWAIPEWKYFLKDVQSRLSSHGRIFLGLNFGMSEYPELKTLFCNFPGFNTRIIDHRRVLFCRVV